MEISKEGSRHNRLLELGMGLLSSESRNGGEEQSSVVIVTSKKRQTRTCWSNW